MLTFACSLLLATMPQEPDLLTALLRCEVRGTSAFTAEAIESALVGDLALLQRLQQGADAETLAAAAAAEVRSGYRRAGFLDAEIDAAVRDGALRLQVREGPQRRCGSIAIHGNAAVTTAAIEAALRHGGTADGWTAGSPAACDNASRAAFAAQVRGCYLACGRHGSHCQVSFAPQPDSVELRLDIDSEGQPVRVGQLQLAGERAEDVAVVLQHVAFQPGAVYDLAFATGLRHELEATGRYQQVVLPRGEDAVDGKLDPFVVQVRLAGFAPPAATTRWQDLAQLQAGLAWLQRELQRGRAVRIESAPAAGDSLTVGGHALACSHLLLHLAADGAAIACDGLRFDDLPPISLRAMLHGQEALLAVLPQHHGYGHDDRLPRVHALLANTPEDEHMALRFGFGVSERGTAGLQLQLHPATAAYLLQHEALQWQRQGGELIARSDGSEVLRIGADGTMHLIIVWDLGTGGRTTVSLADSDLDAVAPSMHPVDSTERPLLDEIAALAAEGGRALLAHLPGDLQLDLALLRAAGRFADAQRPQTAAAPPTASFRIGLRPASDGAGVSPMMPIAAALARSGRGTGWMQTLLEALPGLLLDDAHRAEASQRLMQLGKAPQTGPLARLLIAAELQSTGHGAEAMQVRRLAALACTFESMWSDAMTIAGALGIDDDLRQLGAWWRQQPELQELFADCNGADADAKALRAGFARLWADGLGELVRRIIQAND